jgi:hypothetical protein
MKQSDLFRENANSCLQLAEKAPGHGFVRILQNVGERPLWCAFRTHDGHRSPISFRRVSGITSQMIVRPVAATAASPIKATPLPNLSLT